MQGNAVYRHRDTVVLSVTAAEAPEVVTSASFDEALAETYQRVGIRPGLLEEVAGIRERRWWPEDVSFTDAAALAGASAIEAAGIDPARIGLLVDTSVCRSHLEPSAAVAVHHALGLSTACLNFDLANACLGFVNGMQLAASMIDSGQIDYALVVDGEGSRRTQQVTIDRLSRPETTAEDVFEQFATLTLGSGGAAMVLGRADAHPDGHRIVGGVARSGSEHHTLCIGDLEYMRTDTRALLEAGLDVAEATWNDARSEFDWSAMDAYVAHQISSVHTTLMFKRLGIDPDRARLTFPTLGNMGPASLPYTLALTSDTLSAGDRVLCMGIGSGINTACVEIAW
jgi:3-oxoacyl-[acyl-carrier-protein] synthase-3